MNDPFIVGFAVILIAYLVWGAKTLPKEEWQFLAAMPTQRDGFIWKGVNFTYYGVFSANALILATSLCYVLLRAAKVPVLWAAVTLSLILAVCLPASRLLARIVEKKPHNFTVGGASFVGIIVAPWIILLTNRLLIYDHAYNVSPPVVMAALAISLALGEGTGRLACLSFGCCYGKPLADCPSWLRRIFNRWATVFHGETKKASYAHGLNNQPLIPIQTITAFVNTGIALSGLWFFCQGQYLLACLGVMIAGQGWRILSELLRVDYRGNGRISGYQWMGLAGIIYITLLLPWLNTNGPLQPVELVIGLETLWTPSTILVFQALWLGVFIFMGKSSVTCSSISLQVINERT